MGIYGAFSLTAASYSDACARTFALVTGSSVYENPRVGGDNLDMSNVFQAIESDRCADAEATMNRLLDDLIQPANYIGEVITLAYEDATVQIHDKHRETVGGIPSQCFLIASRKRVDEPKTHTEESASAILLRVVGPAALPGEQELVRIRAEAARRAAEEGKSWDRSELDLYTRNELSFAGVKCRVLGTFYVQEDKEDKQTNLSLRFGADISNYYAALALKLYKPTGKALEVIANYRDPNRLTEHALRDERVDIGRVRYASTDRLEQGVDEVRVRIAPTDLLRQKTALFGMTRTGKSNTTKVIAKSVFALRFAGREASRVGQLIFDYNGEYANENVQDNEGALRNVWWMGPGEVEKSNVVTYGIQPHRNDPDRVLMKINFHDESMAALGKRLIDDELAGETVRYVEAFRSASIDPPVDVSNRSETTRHRRRMLAYRALLAAAGIEPPGHLRPDGRHVFGKEFLEALTAHAATEGSGIPDSCAEAVRRLNDGGEGSWDAAAAAFRGISTFLRSASFDEFDAAYIEGSSSGSSWADADLRGIVGMLAQTNGPVLVRRVQNRHAGSVTEDYTDSVLRNLHAGRLVIIDQSLGDPELHRMEADRVMWRIFREHQAIFSDGREPPETLVYVEEAHNLLPQGRDFKVDDPRHLWARVAKEGAKLRIGLVYATQEVSAVHQSILKNTANWFIGHLNNRDETRELVKFYDFADFEPSILRAQDAGFLRMKTLSNAYIVPIQADVFSVEKPTDAI